MKHPMISAIESAREGIRKGHGGPFGACIVKKGQVVAVAHNTVLRDRDPTCHAEMNAIRLACRTLRTHDLTGCALYTTAEPCPMCLGAIYWARMRDVFVGVPSAVPARLGFDDARILTDMKHPLRKRRLRIRKGVMRSACRVVFKEWQEQNGILY